MNARASARIMSKVSGSRGMLLGESQSMSATISGRRTITVSLGLRPVESTGVQVARAPFRLTIASRWATACSMSSRRAGLTCTLGCACRAWSRRVKNSTVNSFGKNVARPAGRPALQPGWKSSV